MEGLLEFVLSRIFQGRFFDRREGLVNTTTYFRSFWFRSLQIQAGTAGFAAEVVGEALVEAGLDGVMENIVPGMGWIALWRVGGRIKRGERRPGDRRRFALTAVRLFCTGGL